MKHIFTFIFFVVFSANLLLGQVVEKNFTELQYVRDSNYVESSPTAGQVTVFQEAKLESVMNNFVKAYKLKPDKVWRVQIFFGIGRNARFKAEKIKQSFKSEYPGVATYLVFEEPYFKVKVGSFDTKLEAESLKARLLSQYETAFVIEDTDTGEAEEEDEANGINESDESNEIEEE